MTGLRIDPDALAESGTALAAAAERLGDAVAGFRARLTGYGAPWGTDDIGSLIGAAHDEVSAYAFECYQDGLDEIGAAGQDVSLMGETYRAAESTIEADLDAVRRSLGG
ncbi:hypothetical protein J2S43_002856 [Catenuloplanes nepalensis]|uniref:PE domain-containing protein n=1 Tax=Catenuloplanes nepalensis TaxID=587533 RepID=A0ABT9MSJ0_9ACTN|nr:hypothetical protein [Catenuloplanes nepalensis]MDP9794344.1 hypothetical protein [Catenuloplanes nepalensis]